MTPEQVTVEYYAHKQSHNHSSRAATTRASDLGHPCTAYIALTRVAGETASAPDAKLSCIFSEGNLQEQAVKIDLQQMGYRIEQSQRTVYWSNYDLSGHIDGYLAKDGEKATLIEIKSCSPFIFVKLNTVDDVRYSKKYYYRKWAAQLQIYMLLESQPEGWLILKNKATGEIKIIAFTLDLEFAESLIKKAEEVKSGVKVFVEGGCYDWNEWLVSHRLNDPEICLDCPLKAACLPEIDAGAGIAFSDDGEMAEALKERESCEAASHRFKELDEEIKTKAKRVFDSGSKQVICGEFVISGNRIEPKGKAPYWKVDIERVGVTKVE